jgi:Flp pilus assembly CpaE family ATPase
MGQGEFQKALGRKVDIVIADESKVFNDAANTGKPVVSGAGRSKAAKSLRSIAGLAASDEIAPKESSQKSKSWLKLGSPKKTKPKRK